MDKTLFQERIRKLRQERGLSMDELGRELNISKSRINMWENNGNIPRNKLLGELSKFYNVSIDYLLGNEEMEHKQPENKRLEYIQRGLANLDKAKLEQAERVLKAVFTDIFADEEEFDDI